MSYNVKKLPKIICLELGRGWLKSLLYLFPSLSCHPSLATRSWGCLCWPRVALRREKDVPVCHLMPLEERLPVLRTGTIVSEPHFVNWMPVLPDELFSHSGPRALGAAARAPAASFPCSWLLPAPRQLQRHPLLPPSGWAQGNVGAGVGKAAVGAGPAFWGQLCHPGERGQGASSRSICSVLPSLAPGWGSGLRLAWATLQVSLLGT